MDYHHRTGPPGFSAQQPITQQNEMMNPNILPEHYRQQVPELYSSGNHSDGDYTELQALLADGGDRFGVSTLSFDTHELLWMGNQGGHITSYYGVQMQKYTSFQVGPVENEVRQIVPFEQGILSLTHNNLRGSIRRGLTLFNFNGPDMHDMQCTLLNSPTSILIGGHQTNVLELDLNKVEIKNRIEVAEPGCAIFRHSSKFICAGDTSGKLTLFDPKTMKPERVLEAHTGTLSDFDIQGNHLITCGYANRMSNLAVDRFLMVFDMRVMRAMAPIQVVIDPLFLRFVHTYSNTLALVSQSGQLQLIDTTTVAPVMMYHMNTQGGAIMSFDISSTCQAMACGDSNGYIHLLGTGNQAIFNNFSEPTEFADPVEPLQPIHITDELMPFSLIPMIYPTNGKLVSDWPDHLSQRIYRKPKVIDSDILRSMKIYHNIGYAPNPGKERRNQVPYKLKDDKSRKRNSSVPESPIGRGDDPFVTVPKRYRKVVLKYSKLGLEDFDFRHYNKTHFAGLETHIPNVYSNSMLQVLYFIEPLRTHLLSHVCRKEFCLSCELGFLFHMLDIRKGYTCQASNFLRAFRTLPEAAALGLLLTEADESTGKVNWPRLIQSWHRFLHQQLHSETCTKLVDEEKVCESTDVGTDSSSNLNDATNTDEKVDAVDAAAQSKSKKKKKKKGKKKEEPEEEKEDEKDADFSEPVVEEPPKKETSIISELFGLSMDITLKCRCGQETQRNVKTTLINMSYPDCSPPGPGKPPVKFAFADVVKHSFNLEQTTQAWCNVCDKYQPHLQNKVLHNLPDVLALNTQLENVREIEFWKTQQMIYKQEQADNPNPATPVNPFHGAAPVMCRYGNACTRRNCRFKHDRDGESDAFNPNPEDENEPSWVPLGLRITLTNEGGLEMINVSDEEPLPKIPDPNVKYYQLFASVAHIKDKTGGNLVSSIHVGETYHQRKEKVTCTQWYLFNDFSILPIEEPEAISFNLDWKVPCIFYFVRRELTKHHNISVTNPFTFDVLFDEIALKNPKRRKITFSPLQPEELPSKGDLIGLDAEFVSLNQEESELRSDGTRSTIKPSHLSVARITCIRGQGERRGEPFMDEYISTQEQVVDYLTQYSGIQPGDLDPNVSTKHLTTLKSTYQKLRYLIDTGVIFIGHGLKKDFRVINIMAPKDQIIDTVVLFHQPRQRMISLKFLAWYFFKTSIQSFTHDSVEDARTALQLYLKYKEMSDEGTEKVCAAIKELYEYGRKNQWKIPDEEEDILDVMNVIDNQVACL